MKISHLPKDKDGRFTNWETNQGLRVFGWTHANNIPYLLYWLDKEVENEKGTIKKPKTNKISGE